LIRVSFERRLITDFIYWLNACGPQTGSAELYQVALARDFCPLVL